ncbi:RNA polymerase sigma factor [Echinicola salinicaeni]|uniref:RNA polymerase sigma factor n=1 Tax=Echinicola salinicaeni TaxID=2762757 RepID=UPI0016479101|nr:sigma-70 family RNA polymerase sigma factor [Echinicola salinicaeni]
MITDQADNALFEKVRLGDHIAFNNLYDRFWELMYGAAYARVKSCDLAKDIVQEIFVDIWNRKKTIKIRSTVKVYLLTAVKYKVFRVIDELAKLEQLDRENGDLTYYNSNDLLDFEEIYNLIALSLDKLPDHHREIFTLSKLGGLSAKEISLRVELEPQSVHNILSKTSKFMRKELKDHYSIFL